jgi:hypothetical protein
MAVTNDQVDGRTSEVEQTLLLFDIRLRIMNVSKHEKKYNY